MPLRPVGYWVADKESRQRHMTATSSPATGLRLGPTPSPAANGHEQPRIPILRPVTPTALEEIVSKTERRHVAQRSQQGGPDSFIRSSSVTSNLHARLRPHTEMPA